MSKRRGLAAVAVAAVLAVLACTSPRGFVPDAAPVSVGESTPSGFAASVEDTPEPPTLPSVPTAEATVPPFWTDNICPQDVTAPPVTCTFLRTEGSTIRMPLIDADGTTYGMILIDAGHVTVVQATAAAPVPVSTASPTAVTTPTPVVCTVNLNTADVEMLDRCLPAIGPTLAAAIIANRGETGYITLDDLGRVRGIGPVTIATIRNCECTVQR